MFESETSERPLGWRRLYLEMGGGPLDVSIQPSAEMSQHGTIWQTIMSRMSDWHPAVLARDKNWLTVSQSL